MRISNSKSKCNFVFAYAELQCTCAIAVWLREYLLASENAVLCTFAMNGAQQGAKIIFAKVLLLLGFILIKLFFIVFELVLHCFGACCHSIAMHHTNICVVPYMQCHMQLQVQHVLNHASCNIQLANSHSHMILNERMHCIIFANFVLYFLYHYCLHCIVLCLQYLNCL